MCFQTEQREKIYLQGVSKKNQEMKGQWLVVRMVMKVALECGCEGGVEYYGEVSGGDGEDCF